MLDELLEGRQIRSLVDEEVDPFLFNLKVVAFLLPEHAEYVELLLLVAVPDEKGSVPGLFGPQQVESLFPVNIGMVPLRDILLRVPHRILVQKGRHSMVSGSSRQVRWGLVGVRRPRLGGRLVLEEQINAVEVAFCSRIVERNPTSHSVSYCRVSPSHR